MTIAWPLYGHEQAEADFLAAHSANRLHHGWMIEGPSGVGKSIFCLRLAAFLLGAKGSPESPLQALEDDPVIQKIIAESHPDLRWIKRELNERGKLRQDITIEQIRNLNTFFSLKPALGGWRVGVIDSIDEMNRNGLNALLKTLEEPPPQCMLLLVNHGTGPVLPTIRSRCRRLRVSRLSDHDTEKALQGHDAAREAKSLAQGRPGHGLRLASPAGLNASNAARALVRALPSPSDAVITAAIKSAGADDIAFDAFNAEVLAWLQAESGASPTAADLWLKIARLSGEANALNMVQSEAVSKIIALLRMLNRQSIGAS